MPVDRLERVQAAMEAQGVDFLLLSVGPDLPWLSGYEAMPLERLTMMVVPRGARPSLVIPRLEAPRVIERPDRFEPLPYDETADPVALVASLMGAGGSSPTLAVGDHTWARFVLELQRAVPTATWTKATSVTGPLRAVKEPDELEALRRAAAAADRVAADLHAGEIALIGRTEAEVSAELGRRLLAEGHQRVNFAIVAAGENAASPHHEPGRRVIRPGEVVLCDFGGRFPGPDGVGYCSDITRCVSTGPVSAEVGEAYGVLQEAQSAAVEAAQVGTTAETVDAAARGPITAAGFGDLFIHRTGHGIGVEEHEEPYIATGNRLPLKAGNAFSIEPGIYRAGRWGLRLEDIVVATEAGPEPLNVVDHDLVVVES